MVPNGPGGPGEQGVVVALAHAVAGMDLRSSLADQDRAGRDGLSGKALHAQALRLGVAPVARGPAALLVCHIPGRVADGLRRPGPLPERLFPRLVRLFPRLVRLFPRLRPSSATPSVPGTHPGSPPGCTSGGGPGASNTRSSAGT